MRNIKITEKEIGSITLLNSVDIGALYIAADLCKKEAEKFQGKERRNMIFRGTALKCLGDRFNAFGINQEVCDGVNTYLGRTFKIESFED